MSLSLPLQSSDSVQRLELEDGWEILVDPSGRFVYEAARNAVGWRDARVGLSWNVQFEDLRDYMGAAWYGLAFELARVSGYAARTAQIRGGRLFLRGLCQLGSPSAPTRAVIPLSASRSPAPFMPARKRLIIRVVDPP